MKKSIGRASLSVAAMTLLSRILGLMRDILIARYFPKEITDPFFAALRIPNTLRRFFAEGGFANAFVPVFAQSKTQSPEALKSLLQHTLGMLLTALIIITALGIIFSAHILSTVAFGLSAKAEQFALGNQMLKIMFPYILLISLTAMAGGILNTFSKFIIPALAPVLLNLSLIGACLFYAHFKNTPLSQNGLELAWAVLIGGILQLALQLPFLAKMHLLLLPKWGLTDKVRQILRLMVPTLFGSSIGQLSILFNTFLASFLSTGSISWLYYTDRLVELPIALIGVALGTVILPKLSLLKALENEKQFFHTLDWALRLSLVIGSAASVGLIVLAPNILTALFYGGNFTLHDLNMTTLSLRAYAIAVFFLILIKVLVPAFYARQDSKTPVRAGIIAMLANLFIALILVRYFQHVGLAFAGTCTAIINCLLLFYFFYRQGVHLRIGSFSFILKITAANIAMASVLSYLQQETTNWITMSFSVRIFYLLLLIFIGIAVYFIALYALGLRRAHFILGDSSCAK